MPRPKKRGSGRRLCGKRCSVPSFQTTSGWLLVAPVLSLTRWAQRGTRCRAWARNIGPQPVVTPVGDLGTRGLQDKNQREGEGSVCRLFEPQIRSADRYQAGLPNVTARPHGAWECGWELPEYGLCGSSYFLGPHIWRVLSSN